MNDFHNPPFDIGPTSLCVAYYSSAEWGCFRSLGWPMPARVLDLFVEFRHRTNGLPVPFGSGLLGALRFFGLPGIEAQEKTAMRDLAMGDGPRNDEEWQSLLDYCESDVVALDALLRKMSDQIDLPRALLRGRYMVAAAHMEWAGVPVDRELLVELQENWNRIQSRLIDEIDADYGVYSNAASPGGRRSFSSKLFAEFLRKHGIPWPQLVSGACDLSEKSFKDAAKRYPVIAPLSELRSTLSKLRLNNLSVGSDGRNRTLLSVFRASTGRNAPSTSRSIFGPSVWIRRLIQPTEGTALAYIDWSAQEIGIAAALSRDPVMIGAYETGDPYLWLAQWSGHAPTDATKQSHGPIRESFKQVYLAANYGMGSRSLGQILGITEPQAQQLLQKHREAFPVFWRWTQACLDTAMLENRLWTAFGWQIQVTRDSQPRSLRNFPVQGNGAEMLRLACCLATERGIQVCAPVHDALLVEGPVESIDAVVAEHETRCRKPRVLCSTASNYGPTRRLSATRIGTKIRAVQRCGTP